MSTYIVAIIDKLVCVCFNNRCRVVWRVSI